MVTAGKGGGTGGSGGGVLSIWTIARKSDVPQVPRTPARHYGRLLACIQYQPV